ncbi:MAG: EAL domain-containing protein [Pseudomonadota bacterium]
MTDERRPLHSAALLRSAGRIARLGGWCFDIAADCVFWSDEVCDIYEVPHGTTFTMAQAIAHCPSEWRVKARDNYQRCLREGGCFDEELQILTSRGRRVWVRAMGEGVCGADGTVTTVQGALQDISDKKALEQDAQRLARRLTATLESITDAFLMVDRHWNLTYLNREAERLLRCERGKVLGMSVWAVFPEAVGGPYYEAYHKAVDSGTSISFEEYYAPLDLWTEVRAYPSEEGLAIYFLDIRARKAQEAQFHALAFYDRLTGLPNRQLLVERIGHALELCRRTQSHGAVLFLDLDNFKAVNDARGHDKGDILLRLVGERLRRLVRASDTVARFGGDEFVILLEELGETVEQAALHAEEVATKLLQAFCDPYHIAGVSQHSTPSIGVTVFCGGQDNTDDLLKRADLAMYQSKAAGRNTVSFFEPGMQSRVAARAALEADLRLALGGGQFELYYQPQADLQGRMAGVEALLRWHHPQRGMVAPVEFIPVAEETGLIVPLGHWVLRSACQQLARWEGDPRAGALHMAVNVSAHQFHRPDFVEQVLAVLAETGARPRLLLLELTESLLLKDVESTIAKMQRLREAGVGFSLDDFGTGYSSLSYLHRLPLEQLKIDRSFIWDAQEGRHGGAIVRTIVGLGKALGMAVLAEGVETQQQLDFIAEAGCQAYQGYLYSRPLPLAALGAFIDARGAP